MNTKPKTYYEQEVERISDSLALREYHYVQVRQSKAFMDKHYSKKIELENIAAAAFMSRFHYIRIFQQVYGVTPRQYLKSYRIEKAKELLKTHTPITQVCLDVGYESVPTFSKAFKNGTGCTPKEYQRINISNLE